MYYILLTGSQNVFDPENTAIKGDLELQAAIIAIFEADLRRAMASAAAAAVADVFEDLSCTLVLLGSCGCLEPGLAGGAFSASPGVVEAVMAATECLDRLRPDLPAETRERKLCESNRHAAHVVEITFRAGRTPQPPLTSSIPALRAAQWEAGVLIKLLHGQLANQTAEAGLVAESYFRLLNTIVATCCDSSGSFQMADSGFQALPEALITAMLTASEAVARAAIKLPGSQPYMDTGPSVSQVVQQSQQTFLLFIDRATHAMPKAKPISPAELGAVEGLIGTAIKTTLLLAGPGGLAAVLTGSNRFLPQHFELLQYEVVYSAGAMGAVLNALLHQSFDPNSALLTAALRCDALPAPLLAWLSCGYL